MTTNLKLVFTIYLLACSLGGPCGIKPVTTKPSGQRALHNSTDILEITSSFKSGSTTADRDKTAFTPVHKAAGSPPHPASPLHAPHPAPQMSPHTNLSALGVRRQVALKPLARPLLDDMTLTVDDRSWRFYSVKGPQNPDEEDERSSETQVRHAYAIDGIDQASSSADSDQSEPTYINGGGQTLASEFTTLLTSFLPEKYTHQRA